MLLGYHGTYEISVIAPHPILPGSPQAQHLSTLPGVSSWLLEESFYPKRNSICLTYPVESLTTDLRISGKQWLYEVTDSSTSFKLSSGLLYWNKTCLYESNPLNSNSRSDFLLWAGIRPPGWWHRHRTVQRRPESLTLLSTHNNPNYFHWLTQPGLAPLFLQSYFELPKHPQSSLAISHRPRQPLPNFVEPLLSFVAPSMSQNISLAVASNISCRFALQQHDSDVFISPQQLKWLRKLCRSKFGLSVRPWRRIYLSRLHANSRRCLNEQQLMSALRPYGFQTYCLESLPVEAQLRLFSESAVVVGPHGAGFANMIACPPAAAIIELLPRPGSFTHYYAMADQLELIHGHRLATNVERDSDNFAIDPDQLISLLTLMDLI